MEIEPHSEQRSLNRSCVILASMAGAVVLVVLITAMLLNPQEGVQRDPEVSSQAAAVQPQSRAELEKLSDAPQYRIEAVIDPASGQIQGELLVEFTNREEQSLDTLVFRLYPNAASIYGGGRLAVAEIRQGDTLLKTGVSPDPTILPVSLAQPIEPGKQITLTLAFSGLAPTGTGQGYGIFGRRQGSITLAAWYPVLAFYEDGWQTPAVPLVGDALQTETAFYSASLTLPAGYRLASSGTVVSTATLSSTLPLPFPAATAAPEAAPTQGTGNGGWVSWQIASGPARELAAAASVDFQTLAREVNGVTLRLFYRGSEDANLSPEAVLSLAAAALQAYEERYGPYPYNELDIVESPITIDGYEFSGMVMIDPQLRITGEQSEYEYILAHEIAHQWWYGLAGNRTVEEPWLDEAHATYSAVLYFEETGQPEAAAGLLNRWEEIVSRLPAPVPVDSSGINFKDWNTYRDVVYLRGALFIHALRQEIGEENFSRFLRRYQEVVRYGMGSTSLYLSLAEEVAGWELDTFYQPWFQGDFSN